MPNLMPDWLPWIRPAGRLLWGIFALGVGKAAGRASMDADFTKHLAPDILLTHLMEGIGIALDFKGDRMFLTDLAGSVYCAKLDGSEKKPLLAAQGNLTGIAYAEMS